jgi:hypothetical protein
MSAAEIKITDFSNNVWSYCTKYIFITWTEIKVILKREELGAGSN